MKFKCGCYALALLLAGTPLRASSLDSTVIAMFPKNVAEFGYANLDQARQLPWFAQFKQQVLPTRFGEFEQFLASSGINPDSQVKELAWAFGSSDGSARESSNAVPDANQFVGIALGQFDPESNQAALKASKTLAVQVGDSTLFECVSCGDLFVVFIDSNTIAFGQRNLLELMIKVRTGVADNLQQNTDLFSLINQTNDEGIFWGVLGPAGARHAIRRMIPGADQFPQAGKLFAKINGLVIRVHGSDEMQADFDLLTNTPEASWNLSVMLQAGLLLRQVQARQDDATLSKILDTVRIAPMGNSLNISMSFSSDQLVGLIQHNTFVPRM